MTQLRDPVPGVPFEATWVGDGPLFEAMRQQVALRGWAAKVRLPGAMTDRNQLLQLTHSFHVILCCHRTAESARCLQEALVCGCPIVAYHSAYVEGLLEQYHCGTSRAIGDSDGLAEVLRQLHEDSSGASGTVQSDRPQLRAWTEAAALGGTSLDAETTFRQVGRLIQQHLAMP